MTTTPKPTAQTDLEGMPVEYARPPEAEEPATRSRAPDRLAVLAAEYNDAQRSGIIEGALWACRMFLADARERARNDCGMYSCPEVFAESCEVDIEAALRHRFGDEHVDREKKLHGQ